MQVIRHIVTTVMFTLFCLAFFGLLEWLMPIDDHQPPITKRKELKTNLWFWFLNPYWDIVGYVLVIITALVFVAAIGWQPTKETLTAGFGPVAKLPKGWQIVLSLLAADMGGYWTHRFFHSAKLWKFHAIHHAPTELDWLAAARLHPVNEIANKFFAAITVVLLGFPTLSLAAWGAVFLMWNLLIHANVNWTFGWPLKYVFASPVFHRWHHTTEAEAQGKNFAGHVPVHRHALRDVLPAQGQAAAGARHRRRGHAADLCRAAYVPVQEAGGVHHRAGRGQRRFRSDRRRRRCGPAGAGEVAGGGSSHACGLNRGIFPDIRRDVFSRATPAPISLLTGDRAGMKEWCTRG
jgi:sterol desaturase/sphingolipid hydroxylase (fatty acid hydroxylase superfamily)